MKVGGSLIINEPGADEKEQSPTPKSEPRMTPLAQDPMPNLPENPMQETKAKK